MSLWHRHRTGCAGLYAIDSILGVGIGDGRSIGSRCIEDRLEIAADAVVRIAAGNRPCVLRTVAHVDACAAQSDCLAAGSREVDNIRIIAGDDAVAGNWYGSTLAVAAWTACVARTKAVDGALARGYKIFCDGVQE